MKLLQLMFPVFFLIVFSDSYSQQKKVSVSTSTAEVVTSSGTTSDLLENRKSFFVPVDSDNVYEALALLGINLYSIKLPVDRFKKYKLIVYTDNYTQNKQTERKRNEFFIVDEKKEFQSKLSLTIVKTGDSLLIVKWKAPDGSERIFEDPGGRLSRFEYRTLPFAFQEIIPEKKIPILLLGSSWYDEKSKVVRFCTDNELKADLSNDAFKFMPQYYIFSIELKEVSD